MKKIFLFVFLMCAFNLYSVNVEMPNYEFKSTSMQINNEPINKYTVPFAANNIETLNEYNKPRKAISSDDEGLNPGYQPGDPGMPIGNMYILILYCLGYLMHKYFKNKKPLMKLQS